MPLTKALVDASGLMIGTANDIFTITRHVELIEN